MKIGAIIICRHNSSRLPGKILKKIEGRPILAQIIRRLQKIKDLNIAIGTSIEPTDDPIVAYCIENDINYYRGSLENVAERFLKASEAFNYDYSIRVNGDNLFIDIDAMQSMIEIAKKGKFDFISNVKERTFPTGMSIEIVKIGFYRHIIKKFNTSYYNEHVTIYLYEHENCGQFHFYYNQKVPKAKGLKIAIDTKEDFKNAQTVIGQLKNGLEDYGLSEIADAIIKLDEK